MSSIEVDPVAYKKASLFSGKKKKIVVTTLIALMVVIFTYLYMQWPTFSATDKLIGEDENRVFMIETKTPRGSSVTMNINKVFSETVPAGSLATINKTEKQQADENGKAIFKILPGELKNGLNDIEFEVSILGGIKKQFHYSIAKAQLPITLKVDITDTMVNNENIKRLSIVTDPMNTITINQKPGNIFSKTGKENIEIKSYDLLQTAGLDPVNPPDTLETSIQISVTDVDEQKKSASYLTRISTLTNLTVNQPEETDADSITISGKASPGASISISDQNTVSDPNGNFNLSVPLPEIGKKTIQVTAARPPEKKAVQVVIMNRLAPKVALSIESKTIIDHSLTIKGTTLPGAAVTINGQPVILDDKNFSWSYNFPWGVSKNYTFIAKAQKSGYRSSEEKVVIPKMPVSRKPQLDGTDDR